MLERGRDLLPDIATAAVRGVMAVARPLISKPGVDARLVSRTFECFDHKADGVEGFVTISGGKTTTARAMAEKVADIVCGKLGVDVPCRTADVPLVDYRRFHARSA